MNDNQKKTVSDLLERYWRKNVQIMTALLIVWAVIGLGCGILIADWLNHFFLLGTGYPLGFWFAQQGSILVFVLLILTYCLLMNKLDAKHHEELEDLKKSGRRST